MSLSLPLCQSHLSHPAGRTQSIAMVLTAPGSPPFPALIHTAVSQQLHPGASSDSKSTASTLLHAHSTSPHLSYQRAAWPLQRAGQLQAARRPEQGKATDTVRGRYVSWSTLPPEAAALPTVQIPVIQDHYSPGERKPAGSKGGPNWQTRACPIPF